MEIVGSVVSFALNPLLTGCKKIWSYDDQINELNKKAAALKGKIRDFVQEYPASKSEDVIIRSRKWCNQATELDKKCHGRVLNPQIRYKLSKRIRTCVQEYETLNSDLEYHVRRKEKRTEKRTEGSADGFRTAGSVDQAVIIYEEQPLPGKIVGLGVEMLCKEVIHELLTDTGKMWVGIWGTGGVGKTTLAKMINNDIEVQNHFGKNIIWITFGNEGSHEQVRKQLQSKVRAMQLSFGADENSAKIALHKAVHDKRVLFILDDVWVADPLELFDVIKMPSRILLTTRDQHVIDSKHGKGFKAEFLSQEESIKLFKFKAFDDETPQNAKVLEIAEKMAQECDGLPLLIELTGSCMSKYKDYGEWKWGKKLDEFRKRGGQDFRGVDDELFNKMKLSFDELKDDDVKVQDCFLYMAAFPEDFEIDLDTLVKCWRGEDLVGDDAEEEAADMLCFLNRRSLLQYDIRKRITRVHDVVRHLCIRIWKERGREGMYLCGDDAKDDEVCRGRRWKRASLMHSSEKVRDGMYVTDVLLLDDNTAYEKLDSHFFKRVSTTLKVLSLSGTGVTSLSNKIRKLTNLRTLDLKDTKLSNIPRDIFSLRQLRYFNLSGTPVFVDNLQIQALQKLSCLEDLFLVFESNGGAMDMNSVATLHHLRFLELSCKTRESLMVFSQGLGLLKHLQELSLEAGRLDIRSVSESDLTNLRVCQLKGTVDGDLDTLLKSSCKLERLWVEDIKNPVQQAATAQDLTWMQRFSEISHLCLKQGVDLFSLPSLPKLKTLHLRVSSSSGEPPQLGKRTFPCLEEMTLEFGHTPYNDDDFIAMEMNKLSSLRLVVTGTWKHLPLSVTSLTSLRLLTIEGNVERLLPENHASTGGCFPSGLYWLEIRGSENSQCPDDFFEPGGCDIKRLEIVPGRRWQHMLPQSVSKLTHLNYLGIRIPDREYENNMELSMFGGGIEDDDSKFSKLVELRELHISGKGLRQLPRSVARLPLLETLRILYCPTLEKVIADGDDESADNADENLFPSLKKLVLANCGSPFIPLTLKNRSDVEII